MRISDSSSDVCSSDLFLWQRDELRDDSEAAVDRGFGDDDRHREKAALFQQARKVELAVGLVEEHPVELRFGLGRLRAVFRRRALRRLIGIRGSGSRRILDRESVVEGKSVSVRVDLGGRGIIKQKKINK